MCGGVGSCPKRRKTCNGLEFRTISAPALSSMPVGQFPTVTLSLSRCRHCRRRQTLPLLEHGWLRRFDSNKQPCSIFMDVCSFLEVLDASPNCAASLGMPSLSLHCTALCVPANHMAVTLLQTLTSDLFSMIVPGVSRWTVCWLFTSFTCGSWRGTGS